MTCMIKHNAGCTPLPGAEPYVSVKDIIQQPQELDDEQEFPFPLMSKTMQKGNLIQFIVWKSQKCLDEDEADRAEAYFFWKIMELFCRQNGKVMMCEVATLLYCGYSFLRNNASKLIGAEKYKDWCLPLAELLCSTSPGNEHRDAVIKMGDDFASRGLTYGAHICYVVVKVELGLRGQFDLIGCNSLPFGVSTLNEAIMRTETYEYVLSLTSGLAQPNFQIFKLCNSNRLAMLALHDTAFAYCEVIARAVITLPGSFKRTFLERLILLSCKMHKELQQENESEWLLELRQLHSVDVAHANANIEPEQHVPSTSFDVVSEIQDSRCGSVAGESPALKAPALEQHTNPEAAFESRYTMGELLGKGAFGYVYAGVRNEDGKQVAIKIVSKIRSFKRIPIPGERYRLPVEVALMKMVSQPPCCSNIVELLEWFDMSDEIAMVLERPSPCKDLKEFASLQNGRLSEAQTRDIMLQVIQATRHCCDRGVFHRDIKARNLLINTDTLQVKLIDFGCGDLLKDTPYHTYKGTRFFIPPEWVMYQEYNCIPATIWGLGILLYYLLYGTYPFDSDGDMSDEYLRLCPGVSRDLLELITWCLEVNPELRPTFEDLLRHEWFTEGVQDKVQISPGAVDVTPQSWDCDNKISLLDSLIDVPLVPIGIVEGHWTVNRPFMLSYLRSKQVQIVQESIEEWRSRDEGGAVEQHLRESLPQGPCMTSGWKRERETKSSLTNMNKNTMNLNLSGIGEEDASAILVERGAELHT